MTDDNLEKVVIVGAGPAGYTAAIYAARAGLRPVVVAGVQAGGQLTTTTNVENWPGEIAIQGPDLVDKMRAHAEHLGTRIVYDFITAADLSARPFTLSGDGGLHYRTETLIIATGATARWLGLPSEAALRGYGVSACATCDGFFFRGKEVVVVGGGNTAVEEALYLANLANLASKVTLVHRRDGLRAERILQDRLFAHARIDVIWNCVVDEITGDGEPPTVTGLRVRNARTGAQTRLKADGVFVAIGHDPASGVFAGQISVDADGYIVTRPDSTATAVPGVFAAGDVRDKVFRQAVTAAGMGCMAALEAERFLAASPLSETLGGASRDQDEKRLRRAENVSLPEASW